MPYPQQRLSEEERRLRSLQITKFFLDSTIYKVSTSIHLYKSLKDEVDTQYIANAAYNRDRKETHYPTKDPYSNVRTDVIIVPCRRCDVKMNRQGRGGGYYDRFLEHTVAIKVGICFEIQLTKLLDNVKPNDVPMDIVITEKGIIRKRDTEEPYPLNYPFNFIVW